MPGPARRWSAPCLWPSPIYGLRDCHVGYGHTHLRAVCHLRDRGDECHALLLVLLEGLQHGSIYRRHGDKRVCPRQGLRPLAPEAERSQSQWLSTLRRSTYDHCHAQRQITQPTPPSARISSTKYRSINTLLLRSYVNVLSCYENHAAGHMRTV